VGEQCIFNFHATHTLATAAVRQTHLLKVMISGQTLLDCGATVLWVGGGGGGGGTSNAALDVCVYQLWSALAWSIAGQHPPDNNYNWPEDGLHRFGLALTFGGPRQCGCARAGGGVPVLVKLRL
jgi:hypothetical protein